LVERALHTQRAALHHVQIRHRRAHISMSQQLLHRTDVVASLEQMRRKAMAQRVRADTLGESRRPRRVRHCLLHDGLVQVIPRRWSEARVAGDPCRRKNELPLPLSRRRRILTGDRERQRYSAQSVGTIRIVNPANVPKCALNPSFAAAGSIVTRSLRPLP
jgi:hypothetical protein